MTEKERIIAIPKARRLVIDYQRGLIDIVEFADAIIEGYRKGEFTCFETQFMLERLRVLKKARVR